MASHKYLVTLVVYFSLWGNLAKGGKKCTKKDMDELKKKLQSVKISLDKCIKDRLPQDCSDIPDFTGVSGIHPEGGHAFRVYCKQGWTYLAHRYDGSTDFYQPWQVYREGFCILNREHFIGLDNLVSMLVRRKYKLRIELTTFPGPNKTTGYAEYGMFDIADARDNFRLLAGNYSGTAGNSLQHQSGYQFTTYDHDNDVITTGNCAVMFYGAWWYRGCHHSNFFGRYSHTPQCSQYAQCIVWKNWPEKLGIVPEGNIRTNEPNQFYSFKKVEMMIQPLK